MLPLTKAASWFVEHLRYFCPTQKLLFLTMMLSIHQIWNGRFEKANIKDFGIEILNFSIPQQLTHWTKNNNNILYTYSFFNRL